MVRPESAWWVLGHWSHSQGCFRTRRNYIRELDVGDDPALSFSRIGAGDFKTIRQGGREGLPSGVVRGGAAEGCRRDHHCWWRSHVYEGKEASP